MTEDEARAWLRAGVPRETFDTLEAFVATLIDEAQRQNLISAMSVQQIWNRHIADSAQLVQMVPASGRWLDLGAGAGLPGIVVAMIGDHAVTLAESRPLRVTFLERCVDRLGLRGRVVVQPGRVEKFAAPSFDVISARAFAPLDRLFASAHHLAGTNTRWILPKGRSAQAELEVAQRSWQGDFKIVPSLTDAAAAIIQAQNVRPRASVRKSGSKP